jgi:ribonucleoside-diphosphate reductase alpha chain
VKNRKDNAATARAVAQRKTGAWSEAATRVLRERYLLKDADGVVVETPDDLVWRVSRAVAEAETKWQDPDGLTVEQIAEQFYNVMVSHQFLPNSPTLMNAGKGNNLQLSACYVVPVPDSLEGIFDAVKHAALIHQSGGGTGFSFSRLRPEGSMVASTHGVASGPVSFMRIFDGATEAVKQGGTRRGANMGILRVDHPDVLKFIDCKRDGSVTNFNISVAITDEFMRAYEADMDYALVDPHTKQEVKRLRARDVMQRIIDAAWATGDPGLVFIDRANRSTANPTSEIELLEATNPCGEQWLGPYDACNLGSINLGLFVKGGEVDWLELERVTRVTTRFLDDVIEINPFPLPQVAEKVYSNRRIGLGVMGWAEMLFELGLRYDSEGATMLGERVMTAIRDWASDESAKMAEVRGEFPNFSRSIYKTGRPLRNSTRTTVAPTGSISILADCSSGIEPIFALAFQHRVKQPDGSYRVLDFVNPYFQRALEASGIADKAGILEYVKEHGSLHGHAEEENPALAPYVTAHEIRPEWHIRMQAAFQKGVDNSISKCIAAGTLIPTSRGLMAIEDFSNVEEPDTFVDITDQGITTGGHRILSHYYAGEKPATRIRLDNGAELVGSTESHRVLTPNGWVRMAELHEGDLVVGRFERSHGEGGMELPSAGEYHTNAKFVTIPERMSPPLAQFLGMLAADGHTTLSTGAVGLTSADDEVLGEFKLLSEQLFGLKPRYTVEKRNENVRYLTLNSRVLCRWVRNLIGEGAYGKLVPAQVLGGSEQEKLAFLRGVSLDGYHVTQFGLYVYAGMSEKLAYGVAEMCRSFGMPLVRVHSGLVAATNAMSYKVLVSNELQELVSCIERHKNQPAHYATYQTLIDHDLVAITKVATSHEYYSALRSIRQREAVNCDNRTAERFGWPSETPVFRVTAVQDAGMASLYDIEVEDAHEYVVNGMVSHNTINLPNSATREDVGKAYMQAWTSGCLGITIFRDGSKGEQVLNVGVKSDQPVAAPAPTPEEIAKAATETAHRKRYKGGRKTRPDLVRGQTRQVRAPEGKVNVTLNDDDEGLLEVFINIGKAGSDVAALAEALGRLISVHLQIDSPIAQNDRAREVADQLRSIGGSMSIGFGENRVRSLPDAVARALELYLFDAANQSAHTANGASHAANGHSNGVHTASLTSGAATKVTTTEAAPAADPVAKSRPTANGNLCPKCSNMTLYYEEGCKKCVSCGYSEC